MNLDFKTEILYYTLQHQFVYGIYLTVGQNYLQALLLSNNQKRIRGARKMNLFTILVEL